MVHICSSFHDSWSHSMYRISCLHDWAMFILLAVVSLVGYLSVVVWINRFSLNNFLGSEGLEVVWTLIPIVVLFLLSFISLRTLYILEEVADPDLTIKVTGHQWYWSYESDVFCQSYDSYINPSSDLKLYEFRLLEVDKPLSIPVGLESRVLVVSEDVIHSWTVPSLGVNVDAVPGRLNQLVVVPGRSGVVYGQCS